jgi:hypothetical protein
MTESTDAASENIVDLAPIAVAEMLREMGAKSVVSFPDTLTHGPVSAEPKRHRKERLKYWRGFYETLYGGDAAGSSGQVVAAMERLEGGYLSTEQVGSAAARAADGGTVVIWTTPTLEDRLFLWFACHALRAEGMPAEQIAIAEPQILLAADNPEEARYANLSNVEPEDLEAAFGEIFHPELIYVEAAANLWETFASVSPRQFAVSIGHTMKFFPQFVVFAEDYGHLFPVAPAARARGKSANLLSLSEFDRDLLARLSPDDFRGASEILDEDFSEKYRFLGDQVALARLRRWSLHEENRAPYVLAEPAGDAVDNVSEQFGYRLTRRGIELLADGFEPGRKLPLFTIGNARIYAGKKPWVRFVEGESWGFERFEPSK